MREKLTYQVLKSRTSTMTDKTLIITFNEFCDLKMDMEFVNSVDGWATSTRIPTEFVCNGILCKIEDRQ